MTTEEFQRVVEQRLEKTRATLAAKADEYARADRLSNFKKIAAFRDKTPEEVCMALVAKHFAALDDFVADLDRGVVQPEARWDEKVGDIVAYIILMESLVQERLRATT